MILVVLLSPNAEICIYKHDSNKHPAQLVEKYTGPVVLDWGIMISDYVMFPLANHATRVNKYTLHELSKDACLAMARDVAAGKNVVITPDQGTRISLDAEAGIQGDLATRTIVAELDLPGR
jgi:hypothetical protein